MKPEFQKRLITMAVIVLLFSILNTLFKHWIFSSIGFCICGFLCIVRPVRLNNVQPENTQLMECRIAGILLILLGLVLRAKFY